MEGEFGKKLWEILGADSERDGGVLVGHTDLRELLIGKLDYYTIIINYREIELELQDGFSRYE